MHLFGNVAPVAEIEALGVPVLEDAAQAAGLDSARPAARARSARSRRSRSTRPRTSARSATAARSPPTTPRSPSACGCCASTARATRRRTSASATTRASTSSRRRSCASQLPHLDALGATAAAPAARAYARGRARRARRRCRRPTDGARPGVAPLRRAPRARRRARARRSATPGIGASAYYRVPAHRQPAMARMRRRRRRCPAPRRPPARISRIPMSPVLTREQVDEVVAAVARCASGLTSPTPARARPAPGDRGAAGARRRGAGHRARLRADTGAAASASGSPTRSIGRHRGARLAAKALGLVARSTRSRAGRGGRRLRPRDRPRLQRHHGRGGAAAHPLLDDVRLRVGDRAAHRQLPPGPGGRRARGDPARAPGALRRARRKLRRYPGLKEEYYLADFEPDPAVLDELGPRSRSRSRSCARRRPSRCTTASRTAVRPRARARCASAQAVVLPRTPEQRAELGAGGYIVPEQRDRRAVADRLRRPRRLAPAGR